MFYTLTPALARLAAELSIIFVVCKVQETVRLLAG